MGIIKTYEKGLPRRPIQPPPCPGPVYQAREEKEVCKGCGHVKVQEDVCKYCGQV